MCIQCTLIAFKLHFSRNRTYTLRLRMSRDCHVRAVVLLVKNGSSTINNYNRDGSLLSIVPCRVVVLLVLLWAFLRLRRTHRALRVSSSCVDGVVPRHSIELALDISLAPTHLQGPLSPRPSSQDTLSYARAINGEC